MILDVLPSAEQIARHFRRALLDSDRRELPYTHWRMQEVLPEAVCVGIISLPIAPLIIDDCGGVRDRDNNLRTFFTPDLQSRFPVCARLAEALQRPEVARLAGETCGFKAEGSYLRMEYIQDTDGAWLQPHHDVPEKLCSMVIYLCTGPEAADWGTDIYDEQVRWVGRSAAEFNSCTIFIPGANTWHGFEKRKIVGIRRLMEINYVHPSWRDRDQLCFPDRPVTIA
ncbi:MAG: 2OG-Fe(II) oxygenase [Solirubrobacterales bacterium]